jgi:hypothetical protein
MRKRIKLQYPSFFQLEIKGYTILQILVVIKCVQYMFYCTSGLCYQDVTKISKHAEYKISFPMINMKMSQVNKKN